MLLDCIVANAAQHVPLGAPTSSERSRISCSRIKLDSPGERLLALELWRRLISHLSRHAGFFNVTDDGPLAGMLLDCIVANAAQYATLDLSHVAEKV